MAKFIQINSPDSERKIYYKCDYCNETGMMGIGASLVGSGSDENLFDKSIDYECPRCNRVL